MRQIKLCIFSHIVLRRIDEIFAQKQARLLIAKADSA